jgi:hypothetical protein
MEIKETRSWRDPAGQTDSIRLTPDEIDTFICLLQATKE